jgi:Mrp family chromosome partitioning ATPase
MSKNFEILTNLDEERELFRIDTEKAPKVAAKVAPHQLGEKVQDEIAKLVQRVFCLSGNGVTPRAVLFCGIDQGDGASWVASQAARAAAEIGSNSVCIVDLGLLSPSVHIHLGTANRAGLGDAVRHSGPIKNFLESTAWSNFWVLPAGVSADTRPLLVSDRLRDRITELRAAFDFLIFVAPPAAHSNDAAVLGRLLDGVILVVGAGSTRRETARRAKETLEKGQVHLLGTVLNGRQFPIPETLYRRL